MPEAVLRFPEGRYEGEVDDKQIPNGEGCLEFPGNDEKERQSYDGNFKDKKAHGAGLMRWRQGDKYEGEFKEGLRHGKGVYVSKVSLRLLLHIFSSLRTTSSYSGVPNTRTCALIFFEKKNPPCALLLGTTV